MKVLAIGAHPDDLEIFVFGSLASWAADGAELSLAVATDGAGGGPRPADPTDVLCARRRAEAEAGAALLGVTPRFLDFPDGELLPDRALVDALRKLIRSERPTLVVTHAPNDYHADHRALSAAVAHAAGFAVPVLYADTLGGTGFTPTAHIDVTAQFDLKCAAIRAHVSQDPERFVVAATRLAAFRAGECNGGPADRAEAFRFEPRFPFADIRALLPPPPPVRAVILRSDGRA